MLNLVKPYNIESNSNSKNSDLESNDMKAQYVSRKKDNETWSRVSDGYDGDESEKEIGSIEDYKVIAYIEGELPENDEQWPKGAPINNVYKVGNKIIEKKSV